VVARWHVEALPAPATRVVEQQELILKVAAGDQGAHHPIEEPEQPVGWVHALNGRPGLHNADAATNANIGAGDGYDPLHLSGLASLSLKPRRRDAPQAEGELIWASSPHRSMSLLRR
jgi:hypothetical protein